MRPDSRMMAAYLAGKLLLGRDTSWMYDAREEDRFDIRALAEGFGLRKIYERTEGEARRAEYAWACGTIYLDMKGGLFKGYDSGSRQFFAGRARGNLIAVYDYDDSTFYTYRFCGLEGGHADEWLCGVCRSCGVPAQAPGVLTHRP